MAWILSDLFGIAEVIKLGPVAGLQAILLSCGVETTFDEWVAGGAVLRTPLEVGAAVRRAFLLQPVQVADLRKAAARKGQNLVMQVDMREARRILQAGPDAARRGPLRCWRLCGQVYDQALAGA